MSVKLLPEHHLEFLSLKEGDTSSSESTLVKMPHWLKVYVAVHMSKYTRFSYVLQMSPLNAHVDVSRWP